MVPFEFLFISTPNASENTPPAARHAAPAACHRQVFNSYILLISKQLQLAWEAGCHTLMVALNPSDPAALDKLPACCYPPTTSSPFRWLQKTSPSPLLPGHPLSSSHIQHAPFSIPTQPFLPPPSITTIPLSQGPPNPLFLLCPCKRYLFIFLSSKAASFPLCHIPSLHFLQARILHFLPMQGARCASGSQAAASTPSFGRKAIEVSGPTL